MNELILRAYTQLTVARDKGATAVEYGLMVALIAIVIIAAVALVGTNLEKLFSSVGAELVAP